MEWIIRIIFLLIGVVGTALIYRRNRQKMDKAVDSSKAAALKGAMKITSKIKDRVNKK